MIKIGNFMGDDPQAPKFIIIKRILNPDTVPFWDLINPENLPEDQVVIGQAGQISMGDGTYFQNQFFVLENQQEIKDFSALVGALGDPIVFITAAKFVDMEDAAISDN